jgi:phage baseplate assembly protein W
MSNNNTFLGRTVAFPFQLANGRLVLVQDAERIKQSLIEYISEPFGTRFMEGHVGSKVKSLLFEQNAEVLHSLLKTFLLEACKQERNVQVTNISITGSVDKVQASISYRIVQSNTVDTLVYEINLQA